MTIHLTIRDLHTTICETDISSESTVSDLKAVISEFDKTKSLTDISLIFRGEILEDERTLVSYNIKDRSTIFVAAKQKKETPIIDRKDFSTQLKPNNQPDSFAKLMQSSIGKSIMNIIQNNPQAYADMLRSNPIFSQIAESNPQLQHILNDSDMLSESLSMYLNPENQNQTARAMDRMLDAVESMPGGFQALSKQINDLQEPLMDGLMDQFKGNGRTKTNIDTKPPSKPSEDPIPFQSVPQNMGPFAQLFGASPGNSPMFNFMFQNEVEMNENLNNKKTVPNEALQLITAGIMKCRSKGLEIEEMPGFKELVDLCKPFLNEENVNFEKKYEMQLKMMNEMGFKDKEENLKALIQAGGDVDQAVEVLLTQMNFQY